MKVKTAKTAGFCFGVSRAVDKVYELIEEGRFPHLYSGTDHTQRRGSGRPGGKGSTGDLRG